MKRPFTNRLYLIIIVVTAVTVGFITGYIVGSRHTGNVTFSDSLNMKALSGSEGGNISSGQPPQVSKRPVDTSSTQGIKESGDKNIEPSQILQANSEKDNLKDKTQTSKPENGKAKGQVQDEKREDLLKGIYTVQVGAFKDEKEAEILKTKLGKKGYNINIVREMRKDVNLFKVRSGDFNTKREAELFAIRLSKTEGLPAFVVKK